MLTVFGVRKIVIGPNKEASDVRWREIEIEMYDGLENRQLTIACHGFGKDEVGLELVQEENNG